MNYRRYIISLLSVIIAMLALIAAFCWTVNPFGLHESPEIEGFNKIKPKKLVRDRLSKIYEFNRIKPEAIILGSSRSLLIPAGHRGLAGMKSYNLALTSSTLYEQYRMLQHANAVSSLKIVVLGLDETITEGVQPGFSEDRLNVRVDGTLNRMSWVSKVSDNFLSLVSYDALKSSLATIKGQSNSLDNDFGREGMRLRVYRAGGHHLMARTVESKVIPTRKNIQHPSCEDRQASKIDLKPVSKYFQYTLDLAYKNNIKLHLFYTPTHARYYEAQCLAGNWPAIENMKRSVVKTVEERARAFNKKPFPVWDFTGYNSITTENIPEPGDKETLMRWFWESMHTTVETGQLIMNRILGMHDNVPDDFGVLISTRNIEQHLNAMHAARAKYARFHAGDITEVRSLVR